MGWDDRICAVTSPAFGYAWGGTGGAAEKQKKTTLPGRHPIASFDGVDTVACHISEAVFWYSGGKHMTLYVGAMLSMKNRGARYMHQANLGGARAAREAVLCRRMRPLG